MLHHGYILYVVKEMMSTDLLDDITYQADYKFKESKKIYCC